MNLSKPNQTQNCFIMFLWLEKVIWINLSILQKDSKILFEYVSTTPLRA